MGRAQHWSTAIEILRQHPWTGLGPGRYADQIRHYLSGEWLKMYGDDLIYNSRVNFWIHLHSFYLQSLEDYGIPGGLLLFAALGGLIFQAFRTGPPSLPRMALQISIVAYLAHNFVDVLTINGFDFLFAFFLALSRPSLTSDRSR